MTQFFLHGGKQGLNTTANAEYFQRIVQDLRNPANFLCVYIAKDKVLNLWDWEAEFLNDKSKITAHCPCVDLNFILAKGDMEVFTEQVRIADVIYFFGGITEVLKKFLEAIPDLEKLLYGKRIAGSSAGALVWAKYYYDGDLDDYRKGLGFLPVKIICHYSERRREKLNGLEEYGEPFDILKIADQSYFIFESSSDVSKKI